MDAGSMVFLVPIAAIVMGGLVKVARHWAPGTAGAAGISAREWATRLDAVEEELASLQQDLNETQERLDFAERMLAQSREGKRLGAAE